MNKQNKNSETPEKAGGLNWRTGISSLRRLLSWLSLVAASLILIAVVASTCAFVLAQRNSGHTSFAASIPPSHKEAPEEQTRSDKTGFGQFSPKTDAERELKKMFGGKDEDVDLALVNWLIAADIPELHDLTREAYFAQLDAMTKRVRGDMARMQASGYGGTDQDDPKTRCQRFCSAIIGLKFAYTAKMPPNVEKGVSDVFSLVGQTN